MTRQQIVAKIQVSVIDDTLYQLTNQIKLMLHSIHDKDLHQCILHI